METEIKQGVESYEIVKIDFTPKIPPLKKEKDKSKIDVRYCVISPFAFIHIYWDSKIYELVYEVEEPILTKEEEKYKEQIVSAMRDMINFYSIVGKDREMLLKYIDERFKILVIELGVDISYETYKKIYYYLCRDFIGFNEIEPILRDYFIEDIECNGVNTPIYIVHRIYRNIKTNVIFKSTNRLESFVEKLAQRCGKYISYAQPILDGSLPDGSIDYNEPVIYKEEGIVKISKIGEFTDRFYKEGETNKPIKVNNIEVPAFDKNFKITWKKMDYVYRHKINEDIYELKTEFKRKIKLTGCHSIFTLTKDGLNPERTANLKVGDYIALPLSIPENDVIKEINLAKELAKTQFAKEFVIGNISKEVYESKKDLLYLYYKKNYKKANQAYYEHKNKKIIPLELYKLLTKEELEKTTIRTTSHIGIKTILKVDKDLMRFLGLYIAEGWLIHTKNHHRVYFCLNVNESDLIEDIKRSAKNCFNIDVYLEPEKNNAVKLTINSYVLWAVLKKVLKLSVGAKEKRIPEIVFNVNKELQQEFIKAWNNGDFGSTASEELMNDISYLSLFNNDIVSFQDRSRLLTIDNRIINSKEYYTNFFRRDVNNSYSKMIPLEMFNPLKQTNNKLRNKIINRDRLKNILEDKRYQRMANLISSNPIKFRLEWEKRGFTKNNELTEKGRELLKEIELVKKLVNSDLSFAKVKSIKKVKPIKEYVYDFSVKECENFIGGIGGVICHNSRVNATYTKDITSRGPTFTIRKFTKTPWTPSQLLSFNTLSPEMLAYLWILVQYRMNLLITGGTASGKTTMLNAVAFFIPPEARVVSIEDSVTGDSKIIIRKNEKIRNITIKEFVDKKINAEVMTLDEKGKIIFVNPSDYIKHSVKKDIYEIITKTGRKVRVTKDHSLFSLGEEGLIDVKSTELKENKSFIAVPRKLPINTKEINEINLMTLLEVFKEDFLCGEPLKRFFEKYKLKNFDIKKERYRWWKKHNLIKIGEFIKKNYVFSHEELKKLKIKSKNTSFIPILFKFSKEFLEFCGLWLGDGSYDSYNKNSVIISNVDKECIDVFKKIANYLGSSYSVMNDNGVSLRIHSTVFYKFMKNILKFDGYSNTKKIPEFIFNLSNEQIKHFIRGYFSADGCVKKHEISCTSQSHDLLEDLQTLLLRFEIISRINDLNRKDKCINMSISDVRNIKKFKEIGFLQERKNEKLKLFKINSHHTSSDVIPLSTNKIKELNNNFKLSWPYLQGMQDIGRDYLQKISPQNSFFNDLSHSDIFWDKVKKIRKIPAKEIEVFDLGIPKHEKFICNNIFVHNTRELNLPRENWLPSVVREATGVGDKKEIDLFTLLRSSFRQHPDYAIVGEVRGKEAFVLFQGMASGHSSISTMHADSVETVIKRLETPPIELSPTLLNVLDCICIMTHAIVNKQETRKLKEIVEIVNVNPDGVALTNTPFVWNPADDRFYFKKNSRIFERISKRYGLKIEELDLEFRRRVALLYKLYQNKVFGFKEFQDVINEYYKKPEETLKKFGVE